MLVDAFGASWAGCFLLFCSGHWMQLLRTCFRGNDRAFRLVDIDIGFVIREICYTHGTRPSDPQLEKC